jgi:predicted pyridoxine 5'-phosphate oxidase superfamily flavin-nucleotide-binding protein
MDLLKIKSLIEKNPVALATVMNGRPNMIGVAFVKVVSGKELIITDNYMNQTVKDIKADNNICLIVWDKNLKGYKLIGQAKYFVSGKWKKFVESLKENKGLPAKGAILVKVKKIIPSY